MHTLSKKNLLVIASFPEKGEVHGAKVVGGATYTKNTLLALLSYDPTLAITVLAETFDSKKTSYTDENISVIRIWQRNSLLSFFVLLHEISVNHKKDKKILIEFELSMFGGIASLLPFPFFLLALKLLGKDVHMVLHQVVLDLNEMHGHINLKPNSAQAKVYSALIAALYTILLQLSSNCIVFEEVFAHKLRQINSKKRITVIPHGVEQFSKSLSKAEARKVLDLPQNAFVMVAFGFLAWYKGTDWIVEAFKKYLQEDKKMYLILAGGPNPNHLEKNFYVDYIRNLEREDNNSNLRVTGFVPERKISLYYEACDVTIFPYRTLMSSSGPLSLSYSFSKPFLLSNALKEILQTTDVKQSLQTRSIDMSDLIFTSQEDFAHKIQLLHKNLERLDALEALTKDVAQARSWKSIAQKYYETLFT
jgi:glycosyltransferase involved in cell wall biosynthesis